LPYTVLCADIGTTSLKAAFVDIADVAGPDAAGGRLKAFAREPYNASRTAAEGADLWEAAFYRAARSLKAQAPEVRAEALCLSGNGPTLVPVLDGHPLPPLHWFSRALAVPPASVRPLSLFLPHAAYFRQNEPELYKKTSLFLSCHEWLSTRLGAEPVTALPTPYYHPYYYDDAQCAAFSLDSRKFPPFAPLGTVIGHVSGTAARESGLTAGIPVVAGGPDFIMALLGSGAIEPGLVCDRAGSSEGINVCTAAAPPAALAAAHSLRSLPHAIGGLWNVSVVLGESGSLFDRYRMETGARDTPYEETLKSMVKDDGGEYVLHPVLRRILDGVRRALETLREAGYPAREMRHSGGQAKSPLWNRLKEHYCGCRLLVPEIADTELAGNAAAVMFALGGAPTIADACQKIVVVGGEAS
jgi:sugar (pentulose or hexulose) kinase